MGLWTFLGALLVVALWFIYKLIAVPSAMHAEQRAEIESLQPKPDAPRITLIDAIRYLVEESVWTTSLADNENAIQTLAVREVKDKLELGWLRARGREVRNDMKDYERGPKDIPSGFWPGAEFNVLRILSEPTPSTLIKNDATGWQDVTVLEKAVRDAWKPLPEGQLSANRYALAGRNFRNH
jgi:hypothetical protein